MGEDTLRCPHCGETNRASDKTCWACERSLSGEEEFIAQARLLLDQKEYKAVIRLLDPWLRGHPDDASAWEVAGAAFFGLELFPAAEKAAANVVRLRPDSTRAWSNWGTVLRKLGRLEEAREAQQRALQIEPKNQRAQTELRKIAQAEQERGGPTQASSSAGGVAQTTDGEPGVEGLEYAQHEPPEPQREPIEHTPVSGQVPPEITAMGWCWGAFTFTWIWGLWNHVWISLIVLVGLIPYIGWPVMFIVSIWLGIQGHLLAWQGGRFGSLQQFQDTMRVWNKWGLYFFWAVVVVVGMSLLMFGPPDFEMGAQDFFSSPIVGISIEGD